MMFIISTLIIIGAANIWLIFYAPHMQSGPTVNFVLIKSRIEKRIERSKEMDEEDSKPPWWVKLIGYGIALIIVMILETNKTAAHFMSYFVEFAAFGGMGLIILLILIERCRPIKKAVMGFILWLDDVIMPLLQSFLAALKPGPK